MIAGVTVMICTHNGRGRLAETLKYLARQEVPRGVPWEVVIVDNASSDGTAEFACRTWEGMGAPVSMRIVDQPLEGLSHAREKGFEHASFEAIIMCDDDNWLAPDYVARVNQVMQDDPEIGMVGGQGHLRYEIEVPQWMRDFNIFAAGPQGLERGVPKKNVLYGAGSAVRKSAFTYLKEKGFNSLLTDRKAHQLSSGGDHELCYALRMAGYKLWYEPDLHFEHYITRERLSYAYYIKYLQQSTTCFSVLETYRNILASRSSSRRHYSYQLLRSWSYQLKKYMILAYKGRISPRGSNQHIFYRLHRMAAKGAIHSGLRIRNYYDAFNQIHTLRNRLRPPQGLSSNFDPKLELNK